MKCKLSDKQEKFLNYIKKLGRILDDEEAVEYYIENHMTNGVGCRFNPYKYYHDKENGIKNKREHYYDDYSWGELKFKGLDWHRRTLGQLVMRGFLEINFK
jgi:hypothetical protein